MMDGRTQICRGGDHTSAVRGWPWKQNHATLCPHLHLRDVYMVTQHSSASQTGTSLQHFLGALKHH